MYCPQCSQQQISEEMRYCSRCGFPLDGVKELISAGGVLEKHELNALAERQNKLFCSMRQSVTLMACAIPIGIVVGILTNVDEDFAVLFLLPALCFVLSFIRLVYIMTREVRRRKNETAAALGQHTKAQLPPQRVTPVNNFTQRINTAEMVRPPSVTENTTRLLDEEPASQS